MYRGFSMGLLVLGAGLAITGTIASHSLTSEISRFFTDAPTDKTIWMLIGGTALCAAGLAGLWRR